MTPRLLIILLLMALPFVVFFAYRALVGSRRKAVGAQFNETPYQLLFLIGAAIVAAALVITVVAGNQDAQDNAGLIYVPPRVVDGEMMRGEYITREEAVRRGIIDSVEDERPPDPETARPADPEPAADPETPQSP